MRLGLDDFLPNDVGSADAPDGGPVLTGPPIPSCSVYKGKGFGEGSVTANADGAAQWCMAGWLTVLTGSLWWAQTRATGCQQVSKAQRATSCPDT